MVYPVSPQIQPPAFPYVNPQVTRNPNQVDPRFVYESDPLVAARGGPYSNGISSGFYVTQNGLAGTLFGGAFDGRVNWDTPTGSDVNGALNSEKFITSRLIPGFIAANNGFVDQYPSSMFPNSPVTDATFAAVQGRIQPPLPAPFISQPFQGNA